MSTNTENSQPTTRPSSLRGEARLLLRARIAQRYAEAYLESVRQWTLLRHKVATADLTPYVRSLRKCRLLERAERRLAQ